MEDNTVNNNHSKITQNIIQHQEAASVIKGIRSILYSLATFNDMPEFHVN